jgi:hypothetical protein
MQADYPDMESESSKEGDAAHWIAAQILKGWKGEPVAQPIVGGAAPNGVILTSEIIDGAKVYTADIIREILFRGLSPSDLYVETRIEAKRIHGQSFGTCDAFIYDPIEKVLLVWDLKFGYGIVEPFENWQLINYTSGIVDLLDLAEGVTVKMRIAQPRPFHVDGRVREWVIRVIDLRGLFNILSHSAHVALLPNPPIKSGDHCGHCTARHVCPAGQKAALAAVEYSETAQTVELPPGALGAEIEVLRRVFEAVDYRLAALEIQAVSLIKAGKTVDGWAAEPGQGKKVWTEPIEKIIKIGCEARVNLQKPSDVMTPIQAEKAGLGKEVVKKYSKVIPGSLKLVKAADTIAAKAFKK